MKYWKFTFFCFSLLCVYPSYSIEDKNLAVADKQPPLRISIMRENPPYSMFLPDGTPTGWSVEFWELWSKTNNRPITFEAADFVENIEALKKASVDFHAGLFRNDERLAWADFSQPINRITTGIFFNDKTKITKLLRDSNDVKVGVQPASFQESYLLQNYPKLKLELFSDPKLMVTALLDNKIQLMISEIPYINAELGRMGLRGALTLSTEHFLTNEVRAAIPKGHPQLVKIINDGIQKIPVSLLIDLEKKWLPENIPFFQNLASKNVPSLTISQQNWLKINSSYTIGIDQYSPPFEFTNDNNEFSGISSDYIKIIKNKLDLSLTTKSDVPWTELLELAKSGQIDILPAIVKTPKREKFLSFTKPYTSFPMVIATRKDAFFIQQLEDMVNLKVGVIKGYFIEELLRKNHSYLTLEIFDTAHDALEKINQGELDAFVHDLAVITHEINKYDFNEIKIAATTPYNLELSIGVRKGLEPLIPILNKTLETIESKQRAAIANNWIALEVNFGISLTTFLLWATPLIALLTLIILYVVRSNRRLQFEITERKKIEKSLQNAKFSAESANRAKDDFLANMSHEIRTPINAVVGMSYLLEQSGLNSEQLDYINTLNKSADTLLLLINDILDLSKIEAGKLTLESVPFNLDSLLQEVKTQILVQIGERSLAIDIHCSDEIPHTLIGDPHRLRQILLNLSSNAVKFTQQGLVELNVKISQITADEVELLFTVSDTGIGITEKQQQRLFKTYSQADSSTTRQYGGTGLGLAICKNLCELMQGEIWVESAINEGSSFHFTTTLGYQKTEQKMTQSQSPIDSSSLTGKQILLVDDNEVNLIIARKILSNLGMEVTLARDGKQALEALEKETFNAVLMDIQMPVMDGYTATRHILDNPELQNLPIIAMSANVMKTDKQKAKQAGMKAHIGKPLNINEMIKILLEFI